MSAFEDAASIRLLTDLSITIDDDLTVFIENCKNLQSLDIDIDDNYFTDEHLKIIENNKNLTSINCSSVIYSIASEKILSITPHLKEFSCKVSYLENLSIFVTTFDQHFHPITKIIISFNCTKTNILGKFSYNVIDNEHVITFEKNEDSSSYFNVIDMLAILPVTVTHLEFDHVNLHHCTELKTVLDSNLSIKKVTFSKCNNNYNLPIVLTQETLFGEREGEVIMIMWVKEEVEEEEVNECI